MTTRLLVGMLTPAIRATVFTPVAGRLRRRPVAVPASCEGLASDNATPSPCLRGRHRSNCVRLNARVIKGFTVTSSTSARARLFACFFARPRRSCRRLGGPWRPALAPAGRLAVGAALAGRLGRWRLRRPWRGGLLAWRGCRAPSAGTAGTPRRPAPGRSPRHLVDRGHAVDRPQRALAAVIGDQRRGLRPVGGEPLLAAPPDCRRRAAARRAACISRDPVLDPLDQDVLVDLELDHGVELAAPSRPASGRAPRPAARCAESRRG